MCYDVNMKQSLDPRAIWYFFISHVMTFGVFLIPFVSLIFILRIGQNIIPSLLLVLTVLTVLSVVAFLWSKFTYQLYKYELTDVDFRKEHGVIWKRYVSIPYNRIQNVDIHRGIITRILGLSDVNIQTAGSSAVIGQYGTRGITAEGYLPGLSREVAEQLRDTLITKTQPTTNQGL